MKFSKPDMMRVPAKTACPTVKQSVSGTRACSKLRPGYKKKKKKKKKKKNKAGYTVACGWAGAIMETVIMAFLQEWSSELKKAH